MRPRSPGERRERITPLGPSEDPYALDPVAMAPPDPDGFGGAGPWYSTPPGGMNPRFLEGVPGMRFRVTPFDHVVSASRAENPRTVFNAGIPRGNTGFGPGHEVGDISEGAKTGLTALFFLGALGLTLYVYSK